MKSLKNIARSVYGNSIYNTGLASQKIYERILERLTPSKFFFENKNIALVFEFNPFIISRDLDNSLKPKQKIVLENKEGFYFSFSATSQPVNFYEFPNQFANYLSSFLEETVERRVVQNEKENLFIFGIQYPLKLIEAPKVKLYGFSNKRLSFLKPFQDWIFVCRKPRINPNVASNLREIVKNNITDENAKSRLLSLIEEACEGSYSSNFSDRLCQDSIASLGYVSFML